MGSSAADLNASAALLRGLAALDGLSDAAIEKLGKLGQVQRLAEGTVLFNEGDHHDRLYFVCSGLVKLEMLTANCGHQTILSVGSGDLLAWTALIGDGVMTASAIAVEATETVAIVAGELRQVLDAEPAFGYQIMKLVAQALSRRLLATRLQLLDVYHL